MVHPPVCRTQEHPVAAIGDQAFFLAHCGRENCRNICEQARKGRWCQAAVCLFDVHDFHSEYMATHQLAARQLHGVVFKGHVADDALNAGDFDRLDQAGLKAFF